MQLNNNSNKNDQQFKDNCNITYSNGKFRLSHHNSVKTFHTYNNSEESALKNILKEQLIFNNPFKKSNFQIGKLLGNGKFG